MGAPPKKKKRYIEREDIGGSQWMLLSSGEMTNHLLKGPSVSHRKTWDDRSRAHVTHGIDTGINNWVECAEEVSFCDSVLLLYGQRGFPLTRT